MKVRHQERVLQVFLSRPGEQLYGTDVGKLAGLSGASFYPALMRLEQAGWLESDWQAGPYPRRRVYWLNPNRPERETVP
jgi:PadR family transcriptional regulator, regulatory protein PadR